MRAISLWQPWASLMAWGIKHNETRGRRMPATLIDSFTAIHAAKKRVPFHSLDRTLRDIIGRECTRRNISYHQLPAGKIVAAVRFKTDQPSDIMAASLMEKATPEAIEEYICGNYEPGRFAWISVEPFELCRPIPVKGKQGIMLLSPEETMEVTRDVTQQIITRIPKGFNEPQNRIQTQP